MQDKPLKVDFHTHSGDDPFDIIPYSPERLVDEMARQGYDAFAITNHDSQSHTERLEAYAAERGVLLIKGKELTYKDQHIVLLNFDRPDELMCPDDIMKRKGPDNLVVAAHPYFPWAPSCRKLLESTPGLFDAVEFSHLYNHRINFNRKAVAKARELGLPLIGTSDAHTLSQIGYTYTHVYSEKTAEAIIASVKAGRCEVVTEPFPMMSFIGVIARMKYGSIQRIIADAVKGKKAQDFR
jgi:predicted metal-dependent phosphoesterase TrpH